MKACANMVQEESQAVERVQVQVFPAAFLPPALVSGSR